MKIFRFNSAVPFQYNMSGKFSSPNPEWIHLTRRLYDFELFVVSDGVLYIADEEAEYVIEKGSYLLMPPTVKQYGYRSGDCSFYWMHFSPAVPYEVFYSERQTPEQDTLSVTVPLFGKLQSLERMVILLKQLQDSDKRYGMRSLNNFTVGVILAELSAQSFVARKYNNADNSPQLYNDIMEYIALNIYSDLKVADVADYFGYNEKYLTTYFKKWANVSMKQFMIQKKMEYAKAELGETNHSVSQIGYTLGYSDPHNFSNAFKKETGLTPSEYRDSYTKRQLNQ